MSNLLEYPPKAGQASDDKNSLRFKAQVGVVQGKYDGEGFITTPIAGSSQPGDDRI